MAQQAAAVTRNRLRLTSPAQRDLIEILDYLAEHASPVVALKFEARFRRTFADLASRRVIGHLRSDLTTRAVLFYTVWPYLIVFVQEQDGILIHAVVHGARNFPAIARERFL